MRFCSGFLSMVFMLSAAYAQQPHAASEAPAATAPLAANTTTVAPVVTQHAIHLNRFILTTAVQNKEPLGEKTSFDGADHAVFAFLDVKSAENKTIALHWKRNGHIYHTQKLTVKASPRFRTWSHVKALPGNWTVAVEDEQGKTVQELSFIVGGAVAQKTTPQASVVETTQKTGIKNVLTSLEPQKTPSK
jgi:hypothetical protein